MSLNHSFLLVKNEGRGYPDHRRYHEAKWDVEIHDYLICYMYDTLKWIECIHVTSSISKKARTAQGLFHCGPTILYGEGAASLDRVMTAWANLFANAPEEFELTGSLMLDFEDKFTGETLTIPVIRDELVEKLRTLAKCAEKASNNEYYLLHFGI